MAQLWVHSSEGVVLAVSCTAELLALNFSHPSSGPAQANSSNNKSTHSLLGPSLETGTLFLALFPTVKSQAQLLSKCLVKIDVTPRTYVLLTGVAGRPRSDIRTTVTLGTH